MARSTEVLDVDRVVVEEGGAVIVDAACAMPEWRVTRYRKAAILYREQVYFIRSATAGAGGRWRYALEPWPEDSNDPAGTTIHYDQDYVREREALRERQARLEGTALVLFAVTPLLGFLPSTVKLRLNDRYGIHPATITLYSVMIEWVLVLAAGVILVLDVFTSVFSGFGYAWLTRLALGTVIIAGLDGVIRYHGALQGGVKQHGFYEWLLRMRLI